MRVPAFGFSGARRQRQAALVGRTAAASAISGLDVVGQSDACMCPSLNFLLSDFTAWAGFCDAADHHVDAPPG
jgi:hypothetical protein